MQFPSSTSFSSNSSLAYLINNHLVPRCVSSVFYVFTQSKQLWHQHSRSPWTTEPAPKVSALGPVYSRGRHSPLAPLAKCFPVSEWGEASEVKIYKHIPEYEYFQEKKNNQNHCDGFKFKSDNTSHELLHSLLKWRCMHTFSITIRMIFKSFSHFFFF